MTPYYHHSESDESLARRRVSGASKSAAHDRQGTDPAPGYSPQLHSSLSAGGLEGHANAPRRAEALKGAQATFGNRATQRFVQRSGPTGGQAKSDDDGWLTGWLKEAGRAMQGNAPEEVEERSGAIDTARDTRTAASGTFRSAREGTTSLATAGPEAKRAAIMESLNTRARDIRNPLSADEYLKSMGNYDDLGQLVEDSKKSGAAGFMEKYTGRNSPVGKVLRGANYGLQFMQNWASGQDMGEAALGAAGGGFMSNFMPRYLFNKSRGVGWADTIVNVANSGLQLLGAPEEVTGLTQAAADATPTGFATSLASNALRGAWNLGEGAFTGDWSGLKQQGEDITRGRAGAPLQGYGLMIDGLRSDGLRQSRMVESMDKGEYGMLPKMGSALGEKAHDGVEAVGDTMSQAARLMLQIHIENERAAKRRAEIEQAKARDTERTHEIQSRLFDITSPARRGAEMSADELATRVGQDRRLQFLMMNSGKCYE